MRMRMISGRTDITQKTFAYFLGGLKTLWQLLENKKKLVAVIIFWIIIIKLLDLLNPFLFKHITNYSAEAIARGHWTNIITFLVTAMVAVRIISIGLNHFIKEIKIQGLLVYLENHFPVAAHAKLMKLSLDYHSRLNTGEKIAKIDKGAVRLVQVMGDLLLALLPQLFFLAMNVVFIFMMDWRLGLLFLFPFLPATYINGISYRKFAPIWNEIEAKKEEASGIFVQSVLNIFTVKTYVQEKVENLKYAVLRGEISDLDINTVVRLQKYYAATNLLLQSFFYLTIAYGLHLAIHGRCDFGTIVYIFTTGNTTFHYLWMIVYIYIRLLRNLIAVERMKAILDEKPEIKNAPGALIPKKYQGRLEIRGVSFAYAEKNKQDGEKRRKPIFTDLNLVIEPGQKTAIVGATGAGKTTLLYLLSRMYDVDSGFISLDGKNIKELNIDWYRRLFAVALQDPGIFDVTIEKNIGFADGSATEEEIKNALCLAGFAEALSFPMGIKTIVGEKGIKLSGGQKQRLELARAFLALQKGARILILDEPASQLDAKTERIMQNSLQKLRKKIDFTSVVVSHRLSAIKDANKIIVLNHGQVAEQGTHGQLLARFGLYTDFVNYQKIIK